MTVNKKIRNQLHLSFFLTLTVIVCILVWLSAGRITYIKIASENGVWDLRDIDLDKYCVRLEGSAEYIIGEHMSPEEFAAADKVTVGDIPVYTPILTSRVRFLVPDDCQLTIAGFSGDYGSRIFVNGRWLADIGKPGESKADNVPGEDFISFTGVPTDGVVEIVQQTSNFVFHSNSSHIGWTVGTHESVERWTLGFRFAYIVRIGFYLALFLAHLLLLFILPSYRANLWFALLCLAGVVRSGVIRVRPLAALLDIDWVLALRAEYITAVCALVFITLAYNIIFNNVLPKRVCSAMYVISALLALMYLFADSLFISKTMIIYRWLACCWSVFVLSCIAHKLSVPNLRQRIILTGLAIIIVAVIVDSIFYIGIEMPFIHGVVLETAALIFSLFQMAAMFIGTMDEVSAALETEKKLALENAALDRINKMKTDIMATVSHELRTPLAVMMGFAQLTSSELKDMGVDAHSLEDLDAIANEARRLIMLLDETQNVFASKEAARGARHCSAEAVIRHIAKLYTPITERKSTRLNIIIEKHIPPVACDPNELTQVLFNLLNNADRHTKNGEITIYARCADAAIITVSDTGDGISAELLPRVFERYRRGEGGGNGLGLSICKEIIEAHNGSIAIESDVGSGTEVTLTLPFWKGELTNE